MPQQLPLLEIDNDSTTENTVLPRPTGLGHPGREGKAPFPQLLKWIGNKHRFAREIVTYFPSKYGTYFEPFLGSGAVLGTLAPAKGVGSDVFAPLMEIWCTLKSSPETLKHWYAERWHRMAIHGKAVVYEEIKASYNEFPNGADLLILCRSCYGGVVRFRQADGFMSTPCGIHEPISPESFARRVDIWAERVRGTAFACLPFEDALASARPGDLVYCDPPYTHTQSILYGAQGFDLVRLFAEIERLKRLGVFIALSIDGTKKSGNKICDIPIPQGLFAREVMVNCGRSMLKRFQMKNQSLESEVVADRLMLTY